MAPLPRERPWARNTRVSNWHEFAEEPHWGHGFMTSCCLHPSHMRRPWPPEVTFPPSQPQELKRQERSPAHELNAMARHSLGTQVLRSQLRQRDSGLAGTEQHVLSTPPPYTTNITCGSKGQQINLRRAKGRWQGPRPGSRYRSAGTARAWDTPQDAGNSLSLCEAAARLQGSDLPPGPVGGAWTPGAGARVVPGRLPAARAGAPCRQVG